MNAIEAVNEIIKIPKYYTHALDKNGNKKPMAQSTAYRIVVAIKAGTCKTETERDFLFAFGYVVKQETQYSKI